MDQHPVPRQITSFQFKLIGFMTIRQFLYLLVFFPSAYIVFAILPIPLLNIIIALLIVLIGLAFAFLKIQDRPLEEWIKNFMKRLGAPTQYFYQKSNPSPSFLNELYYSQDPHIVISHIDTKEKLVTYMASQAKNEDSSSEKLRIKQQGHIDELLMKTKSIDPSLIKKKDGSINADKNQVTKINKDQQIKQPFLTGVVKNRRQTALPGVLISIKNEQDQEIRLLKSNPHGVFATYSPLDKGLYKIVITDPNSVYFFDTINIEITSDKINPLTIISKEIL